MKKSWLSLVAILLIVMASCKKDKITPGDLGRVSNLDATEHAHPRATFTINPDSGTTSTNFRFDASGSTNAENPDSQLLFRWDFENDGVWDSGYSTDRIIAHQFPQAGNYNVKLEIKDGGGLTDTEIHQLAVGGGSGEVGTFFYDSRTYAYKAIGTQIWMIENLAYLPSVSPSSNGSISSPYYYVYDYEGSYVDDARETDHYKDCGVLYNWEAAKTACPPGWKLPGDDDWKVLEKYMGMNESDANIYGWRSSGDVGKKLKSTTGWLNNRNGDNSIGFNALPGGRRNNGGSFYYYGEIGLFWSSSEDRPGYAWRRGLDFNQSGVYRDYFDRSFGLSVRCLKK